MARFENPKEIAQPQTVFLNIFDLASALSVPNAMFCNTMPGAFHVILRRTAEVYGLRRLPRRHRGLRSGVLLLPDTESDLLRGMPRAFKLLWIVWKMRGRSFKPRHHPVHVYRQSINLGETSLKDLPKEDAKLGVRSGK